MSSGSRSGFGVDEIETVLPGVGKGFYQVGNPIGDVMEAGPSLGEKPAHRGVRTQGFENLQGTHEGDTDALGLKGLHRGTRSTGHELELRTGLLQGGYGHGDVVQRVGKHFRVVAWMGLIYRIPAAPEPGGMVSRAALSDKE